MYSWIGAMLVEDPEHQPRLVVIIARYPLRDGGTSRCRRSRMHDAACADTLRLRWHAAIDCTRASGSDLGISRPALRRVLNRLQCRTTSMIGDPLLVPRRLTTTRCR